MPRGLDPYAGANYRVTLRQTLKGDLPKSFNIFSENTSARTPLVVGHNYIVFLHRAPNSDEYVRAGALTIDNCGNSGPLAQKHGIVAEVRQLAEGSRFATERR